MTQSAVRTHSAPPLAGAAGGLLRWVSCHNPFYVVSAGLFLAGLWASFQAHEGEGATWTLMGGLAAYTMLLALTAVLLVRFAKDWEDLRTVLLLVVLMFLATSVTFDEVLIVSPARGRACYLLGFAFAIVVSEGLLRGIRLKLPSLFRVSYYLILSLFFLYPLALGQLAKQPHSEELLWGLFSFSTVAGLVFLCLLPAIRRGANYVEGNGSPWGWPVYPWVLFGLLGLAVPARAFLLCWSMHLLPVGDRDRLIFGYYFVVPFGLAACVLLLEMGLISGSRGAQLTSLAMPVVLIALAMIGHREDPIYREFLEMFTARLGGHPLYLSIMLSAGFFAYAALRRVPIATESLTAAFVALACINPDAVEFGQRGAFQSVACLGVAAILQLALGYWRRSAWRCLFAVEGLIAVAVMLVPEEVASRQLRAVIAFHLSLFAVLVLGAIFHNQAGRVIRTLGAYLILAACMVSLYPPLESTLEVPGWAVVGYPLLMACLLAAYGKLVGHRASLKAAVLILPCWLARAAWYGYFMGRQFVAGIDQIALSAAVFALAILISLSKSGLLGRWAVAWGLAGDTGQQVTANGGDIESPAQ